MMAAFDMLVSREKKALKESIRGRESEFRKRYGIGLPDGRIDLIAQRVIEKGYDVNTVFEEVAEVKRQVEELEREFDRKHGIRLQFEEEAIDRITAIALDEDGKGAALCSRLFKDYEHGLKLIRDKIGQKEFVLPKEAVENPEGYLNTLIREMYSRQSEQTVEGKE
jgi:hypothetical protein